jgi:hypothetical protein
MAGEHDITAQELGLEASRSIPRATPWGWLLTPRVPTLAEGATGNCKRCGRRLPVFSDPIAFGPMGRFPVVRFERSEMESALLCLVCGPRSRSARPFSAEGIVSAAAELADALSAKHWRRWHRQLRATLEQEDDNAGLEHVGQVLELLRRFGPGRRARARGRAGDPLEILVVSSGPLWLARESSG